MRSNFIFVFSLVIISCVFATQTSFQSEYSQNAEFKSQVDKLKTQSDTGSVIMTLAELETQGRFTPLFDAISGLSSFLEKQRISENESFARATAQFHLDVDRLTKARNLARFLWSADNSLLRNKLYPRRRALIALLASLRAQLVVLRKNLAILVANRKAEVAIFKTRSNDYSVAISALAKALPLLNGLRNGQSFAEVDVDVFAQVQSELKQSLGKLEMGQLYISFVDQMMKTLNSQNFVNQSALTKVISLIKGLKARLERGLVALNNDEALNKRNFNSSRSALKAAIANVLHQISLNTARLAHTNKRINQVQAHRKQQILNYNKAVADLVVVNKNYVNRTQVHNQLIAEINAEQLVISNAVTVLKRAGIQA